MDSQPVIVTFHAANRLVERCGVDQADANGMVYREVQEALTAGRRAKRPPSWCIATELGKRANQSDARYVWDVNEQRCYAIVRRRARNPQARFKHSWVVLTTLPRMDEERIARHDRLRAHVIETNRPRSKWKRGRGTRR